VDNYGNKIANLFADRFNIKKGDAVALFMENKPEFVGIWYGLSKLGGITSLINTNLRTKALIHSIECSKAKVLIFDDVLKDGEYNNLNILPEIKLFFILSFFLN
jgi:solute carrier family 27 (fatty acid transporter), member 1/4